MLRVINSTIFLFPLPPVLQKETLDLRYNEMWNDWDGTGETATDEERRHPRGQLVLSWKRLNVTVKRTAEKFFTRSHTTYTQILHNGKVETITEFIYFFLVCIPRLLHDACDTSSRRRYAIARRLG